MVFTKLSVELNNNISKNGGSTSVVEEWVGEIVHFLMQSGNANVLFDEVEVWLIACGFADLFYAQLQSVIMKREKFISEMGQGMLVVLKGLAERGYLEAAE